MKRLISVLLILFVAVSLIPVQTLAYGSDDKTLVITHINYDSTSEGTGIVYTSAVGKTLGAKGGFAWCIAIVCEWDADAKVYKITKVDKALNSDKSAIAIPENGFVYCINLGNNWPQLAKDDPVAYGAYANNPNYVTEWGSSSFNYSQQLSVGETVYLYGTDLLNGSVENNGKYWYDTAFVSDSYMKIGSPDSGKTSYDPEQAKVKDIMYDIQLNQLNGGQNEGVSMLITRSEYGDALNSKGSYGFEWWKTATFDWDDKNGCYICVGLNFVATGNATKNVVIPEHGFVYAVNLGNDYSGNGGKNYLNKIATDAFYGVESVTIGCKAYLCGVDLAANTINTNGKTWYDKDFTSDAHLYINTYPSGKTVYKPKLAGERLSSVKLNEIKQTSEDYTFTWSAVSGAEKYMVTLYDSSIVPEGKAICSNIEVDTNSYTVERGGLTVGYTYTLRVTAAADGKRESLASTQSFYVYSEKAATSPYRDSKIVAFGDSITAFTGWVTMLTGELGTEVINSGVGGDTTENAVARLDEAVLAYKPDVVIVNFGMNDQAIVQSTGENNVSLEKYEKNYRTIIEKCQTIGTRVILVTAHYACTDSGFYVAGGYGLDYGRHDNWDKFVEVQKKLASEYKLERIPVNEYCLDVGLNKLCASGDGIHLSPYGQDMYTKWISDFLYNNAPKGDEDVSGDVSSADESEAVSKSDESEASDDESKTVSEGNSSDVQSADGESAQSDDSSKAASSAGDGSVSPAPDNGTVLWICIGAAVLVAIAVAVVIIVKKKK